MHLIATARGAADVRLATAGNRVVVQQKGTDMKLTSFSSIALAVTIGGWLSLCAAVAAPVNCAENPYCPYNVVVPAPHSDGFAAGKNEKATSEILIDIDEPLPFSVTFENGEGGLITFVQRIGDHTADVTTSVSSTDGKSAALLESSAASSEAPKGFVIVAQYRVVRNGDGTITVTHTVREPGAKPYNEVIPVHVR